MNDLEFYIKLLLFAMQFGLVDPFWQYGLWH